MTNDGQKAMRVPVFLRFSVFILCMLGSRAALADAVAVAWNESSSGWVRGLSNQAPWEFVGPAVETGENTHLRSAFGNVFALSEASGNITVIDGSTWMGVDTFMLGASASPVDIAFSSATRAYVTRRHSTHLMSLDLTNGATEELIDLSAFADANGMPQLGSMVVHQGRLFVALARVSPPLSPSLVAVIDLATETLIDVDPVQPGIQAIELLGTAPKFKMQVIPSSQKLLVSASGAFFDDGGIEEIDVLALTSNGLLIPESSDQLGADLGSFVMVTESRGYLVFSTDLALSSHLTGFETDGSIGPENLYVALPYAVPTMVHDPATRTFFMPEAGSGGNGVHVFDDQTAERLTSSILTLPGIPTDLTLLCAGQANCDQPVSIVPTLHAWSTWVLSLILAMIGILTAPRRIRCMVNRRFN